MGQFKRRSVIWYENMTIKKGDIWVVELPQLSGHEQEGIRPAIVLTNTPASVAVVIPCTSNSHALKFPYTLLIEPSTMNGLSISSIALILQIRAIDKKRLKKQIGTLERSNLIMINKMIKSLLAV